MFYRLASLLSAVVLAGCYSLGPLVTDVSTAGIGADGRPQIDVRRCYLKWGAFKQLQLEECHAELVPVDKRKR